MAGVSGRVLVVDDNKVIRQLIRVNLELEGFEVVTAADGAECLDVVRRARPDVVTLDVTMPRLDGISAAERMRADPGLRGVRIAVVSACNEAEVERGVAVGVDAFLGKPFEPAELVALVRRLAGARAGAVGRQAVAGVPDGAAGRAGAGVSDGAGERAASAVVSGDGGVPAGDGGVSAGGAEHVASGG